MVNSYSRIHFHSDFSTYSVFHFRQQNTTTYNLVKSRYDLDARGTAAERRTAVDALELRRACPTVDPG